MKKIIYRIGISMRLKFRPHQSRARCGTQIGAKTRYDPAPYMVLPVREIVRERSERLSGNQNGLTVVKVLIWILVFGVLIAIGFVLINQEKAKTRDAKRIADIIQIQAAFEFLFNDTNSYEQAASSGCDKVGDPVSKCNLAKYLPDITNFHEPNGKNYIVTKVPNDIDYEIAFTLEKSYKYLKAGNHVLTPSGIN